MIEEIYKEIVDDYPAGIVGVVRGKIVLSNTRMEEISQYPREELKNMYVWQLFTKESWLSAFPETTIDIPAGKHQLLLKKRSGATELAEMCTYRFKTSKEEGTACIIQELKERADRSGDSDAQALKETYQELRKICHDMNQPLTVIMARADLMKTKLSPDDPNAKAVETILQETERLAQLILKLSRIYKK